MFRVSILSVLFMLVGVNLMANNVRLTKELSVDVTKIEGTIVTLDFSLAWDNSWRDVSNWDAVYVFAKFKKKSQQNWQHVNLMDEAHVLSDNGLEYWMGKNNTTANVCQGIFIYRKDVGNGPVETDVSLKWQITTNSLQTSDFINNNIECVVSCIEMVYIPKGPFMVGDGLYKQKNGTSSNRLKSEFRTILPEWDLIKDDGKIVYEGTGQAVNPAHYQIYNPANAANRVSENRSRYYSNAWYPIAPGPYTWTVDFGEAKTVRWFGVNGVYGYEGYVPKTWELWGMNSRTEAGTLLFSGIDADWPTSPYSSYPITKALKITKPGAYRYYQIRTSAYQPMANNISMTEVDLDSVTDNLFVIDRQYPVFIDAQTGMSAITGLGQGVACGLAPGESSPNWNSSGSSGVTIPQYYPTGFEEFFVMKYEVTQEQYIRFLNMLGAQQQRQRTIGSKLDSLEAGDYVYAPDGDHSYPHQRNGIIVGSRIDENFIFASNLNPALPFYGEDDGQTLACNFLSPADMLAYADWTGLRPLSELEYEKMARHPYPYTSSLKEWAGGIAPTLSMPKAVDDIVDGGKTTEYVTDANVNAGGKIQGPVRAGSFAYNAYGKPVAAGASFWGVMELSGNLSEIHYNMLPNARNYFNYLVTAHGDGVINAESATDVNTGNTNMSTSIWPQTINDFMLRGGNFNSTADEIAVSDRTYETYFKTLNQKDSTVTFRLGHTHSNVVTEQCTTYLKLQNGNVTTGDDVAIDTVCSGDTYTITGSPMLLSSRIEGKEIIDVKKNFKGECRYYWFIREHAADNTHWRLIRGEHGQNLTFSDMYNGGEGNTEGIRYVYFKRMAVTQTFINETHYARICVINNKYSINRLRDTIKDNNQSLGFYIETKVNADFEWRWKSASASAQPLKKHTATRYAFYAPNREDFNDLSGQNQIVTCDIRMMTKCKVRKEFEVYLTPRKEIIDIETDDITMKGEGDPATQCGVMMQDVRDGNVYGTVQIGNQCWMAENLRYEIEGRSKRLSRDPKGIQGLMYNWDNATNQNTIVSLACPKGWRMPLLADFTTLRDFVKGPLNNPGIALKAGNYWLFSSQDHLGDNSSGFGAMGIGYVSGGSSDSPNDYAYYITADGYYIYMYYTNDSFDYSGYSSSYWMPIRCIKK